MKLILNPPTRKAIGSRLRSFRESIKLNQRDFAKKLGTTPNSYSRYEAGRIEIPLAILVNISKTFEISLDWLLIGITNREKPPTQHTEMASELFGDLASQRSTDFEGIMRLVQSILIWGKNDHKREMCAALQVLFNEVIDANWVEQSSKGV